MAGKPKGFCAQTTQQGQMASSQGGGGRPSQQEMMADDSWRDAMMEKRYLMAWRSGCGQMKSMAAAEANRLNTRDSTLRGSTTLDMQQQAMFQGYVRQL
ncbi:hypothetical protein LTR67_008659 [Exophiala xenobiotica]